MILEGLGLLVEDMAAMIRFYRDALGFEITEPENAENVYRIPKAISLKLVPLVIMLAYNKVFCRGGSSTLPF